MKLYTVDIALYILGTYGEEVWIVSARNKEEARKIAVDFSKLYEYAGEECQVLVEELHVFDNGCVLVSSNAHV